MADELVRVTPQHGLELHGTERLGQVVNLTWVWVVRETKARYRQSVLKASWSLIQPLVILLTYGWVLATVLEVSSDGLPYLSFAWAGLVPFTFFQQAFSQGVGSLQLAGPLISRVYFPREVIPLSTVVASCTDLALMTGLLVGVSWFQIGAPTLHLLALVPINVVLIIWVTACCLAASAVTVFWRDLLHAAPLVLRVVFIASPVMYSATVLGRASAWNPIGFVIEGTRDATLEHVWPDWTGLGLHFVIGVVVLLAAYTLLRRLEPTMSDHV